MTESEPAEDEIGPLYDDAVGNGVINAIINQYFTSLGEAETDPFLLAPFLLWILFVCSLIGT